LLVFAASHILSGMNRIDGIFAGLRARRGKALMPFLTAGDPDLATTGKLLPAIEAAGASVCELGIPFSDPIADGPMIQASMSYALERGVKPAAILEMVSRGRAGLNMGLVAMVSYSVVYRLGPDAFLRDCKAAGIDGFIFPDLPVEESDAMREQIAKAGLILSFLIAPTTPGARAETIARACTGFVYVLSRAGITGERPELPRDLPGRITRLRNVTDLPIAVGFGVSSAEQVSQVVAVADAAIVGSAVMRRVAESRGRGSDAAAASVAGFVAELAGGLPSLSPAA
jgi:tryptophan synthase alpha chain